VVGDTRETPSSILIVTQSHPMSETQTFRLKQPNKPLWLSIIAASVTAFVLIGALFIWEAVGSTGGGRVVGFTFGLLLIATAPFSGRLGLRVLGARVELSAGTLKAYNLQGKPKLATAQDVASIDMGSRTFGRSVRYVRVPYVKLRSGTGFYLDALAGGAEDKPPMPEQLQMMDEIRGLLQVGGSDQHRSFGA
jgi:hypothetical protein